MHRRSIGSIFPYIKLTEQLKLLPTPEQISSLKYTLKAANAVCTYISQIAWANKAFGKFALQKLCYQHVRETFGLAAQMTIRALARVGDAYKLDKETKRTFRPLVSIAYDGRILSFALPDSLVSIVIAARNIRGLGRAVVSRPDCSEADSSVVQGQSPSP